MDVDLHPWVLGGRGESAPPHPPREITQTRSPSSFQVCGHYLRVNAVSSSAKGWGSRPSNPSHLLGEGTNGIVISHDPKRLGHLLKPNFFWRAVSARIGSWMWSSSLCSRFFRMFSSSSVSIRRSSHPMTTAANAPKAARHRRGMAIVFVASWSGLVGCCRDEELNSLEAFCTALLRRDVE